MEKIFGNMYFFQLFSYLLGALNLAVDVSVIASVSGPPHNQTSSDTGSAFSLENEDEYDETKKVFFPNWDRVRLWRLRMLKQWHVM